MFVRGGCVCYHACAFFPLLFLFCSVGDVQHVVRVQHIAGIFLNFEKKVEEKHGKKISFYKVTELPPPINSQWVGVCQIFLLLQFLALVVLNNQFKIKKDSLAIGYLA